MTIEAGAKRRLADEYDAAQERGEARRRGGTDRFAKLPDGKFGPADIGIGEKQLYEARIIRDAERIGHGNFLPWIEAEFGMSERSAQNCIAVAQTFKSATVSDLPATVLYALAAPSTEPQVKVSA